jgi:hypothetical protein
MATTPVSQFYRLGITYTEAATLSRVLDAVARLGLEPAWLLSRIQANKRFKVDMNLSDLCPQRAGTLAARLSNIPTVVKVHIKAPSLEHAAHRRFTKSPERSASGERH